MNPSAVSVPGKLFLLGEYAVLSGGPALLSAVGRRIHIRPQPSPAGYTVGGAHFENPRHLPELVAQALRDLESREIPDAAIDGLSVDVSEFYHQGQKLGLGSSAASTVALVKSLAPDLSLDRQFEVAFKAHRALQNGRGSGADVALSTYGGLITFQLGKASKLLALPEDLQIHAVWTGAPAHSVSFIDAVNATRDKHPRQIEEIYSAIAESAQSGIAAVNTNDPERFLQALTIGDRLMDELGHACELPIITDAHRHLGKIASEAGLTAKPSGAGGGDFTLLAGPKDALLPPTITNDFLVLPL